MEPQNCNLEQLPEIAVIMVPLPGQSHINQLLHLSHAITSYGIPVHFAGSATHNQQAKLRLQGWDPQNISKIKFHDFQLPPLISTSPSPNLGHCVPFPAHFYPLFEAATKFRYPIIKLIRKLSSEFKRLIVVHDIIIASVVQDVKLIPNAECYSVIPISAFTLFFDFWENLAENQKTFQLDSEDNSILMNIPSKEGCTTPEIDEFVGNQFEFMGLEAGRIYNTSMEIEPKYVELLKKLSPRVDMKHFVLGPFNPVEIESKDDEQRHQSLKWLDEQEEGSVIYVSFGSTTTLSYQQITELAIGLERSQHKFVWVLRDCDTGDIVAEDEVRRPQLPVDYENRVKNRGIIVRDWAPQLDILAHPSTGGFMSHCGWNSCIESMSMGVAIAAWPMHSDQPRNAVLVTDVLKIGTLVRDWKHRTELVTANTIENAVKTLMATEDGKIMRKRAVELGVAVRGSVGKGGSAQLEMDSFIAHITR